jgi:hypothetical protein
MVLNKLSTPNMIKKYFLKVFELSKSSEEFPVDLDDVWQLVYPRKDHAIRELKKSFIEGEDYNLLKNGEVLKMKNLQNGVKIEGKLTVACMEYFIAKRVRAVFEVYRQVFHNHFKAINGIFPIVQGNMIGYPRKEFLLAIGRSATSGSAYRLKHKYPNDVFVINRIVCISPRLASLLFEQSKVRQLALDFNNPQNLQS